MRKALERIGRRVFPNFEGTITANVIRNQVLADLKKTVGAGGTVAAGVIRLIERNRIMGVRSTAGRAGDFWARSSQGRRARPA